MPNSCNTRSLQTDQSNQADQHNGQTSRLYAMLNGLLVFILAGDTSHLFGTSQYKNYSERAPKLPTTSTLPNMPLNPHTASYYSTLYCRINYSTPAILLTSSDFTAILSDKRVTIIKRHRLQPTFPISCSA